MICPKCGAANADGARFCGACGAAASLTFPAADARAMEPPSLIGREIAGRFRIVKKIGEGGMGAVYRAEQISLKRTVAVKLLRPEVAASEPLVRRFNAEAEAVAKLSHPNTVGIYDFGQDTDGTLFISMEYIEGKSLRAVVHQEAPLPPARALSIAAQIAASLIDAHSHGLVHRDLKPDNVMLQDRGRQRDIVRVLDFGIAKLRDDSRQSQAAMTQAGDMLGTPQYMAPEQIRGEAIDGRTDVYALGCILYELLTGRLPFEAPTVMALLSKHLLETPVPPSQRRPDLPLPRAIDDLVMTAMAKLAIARPQTMEQYAEQIARIAAMYPPDPGPTPGPPSSPHQAGQPSPSPSPPPHGATPHGVMPYGVVPTPIAPSYYPPAPAPAPAPAPSPGGASYPPQARPSAPTSAPRTNHVLWIGVAAGLVVGGILLALVLRRGDPIGHGQVPPGDAASTTLEPDIDHDTDTDTDTDRDDNEPEAHDTNGDGSSGSENPPSSDPTAGIIDQNAMQAMQAMGGFGGTSGNPFGSPPAGVKLRAVRGFRAESSQGIPGIGNADEGIAVVALGAIAGVDLAELVPASQVTVFAHNGVRTGISDITPINGVNHQVTLLTFTGRSYATTVLVINPPGKLTAAAIGKLLDEVLVLPDDKTP